MTTDHAHPTDFNQHRLSPADQHALDDICSAGWDPRRVSDERRHRADRIVSLLSLLDRADPGLRARDPATLADVTMARVLRAAPAREPALSTDDQDALDAFVTERFSPERVPASLRPRAERLALIGSLLTASAGPAISNPSLVERTLSGVPIRVRRQDRSSRAVFGGFRLGDLVSVAATLLIASSILVPMVSTVRSHQARGACGTNYATLAGAFGMYSNDYRDQLPVAAAGLGGGAWWEVGGGPGKSNSANLFRLPKLQYTTLTAMACPNNDAAPAGRCPTNAEDWSCISEVSYSYQNMFGESRPRWSQGPRLVILADASPVVRSVLAGSAWVAGQNSANHGGKGQWVLRNDGSGGWVTSPVVDGDNIWLTTPMQLAEQTALELGRRGVREGFIEIRGREFPSSEEDAFLTP
ncbi:MAG: hypothetical protein SFY69_10695 [Planctomycetota bacterium]|nr:hypothetical protein [Planctomycetota bacterium]